MKPALLIIDMQEGFVRSLTTTQRKIIIPAQIELARYFSSKGLPIAEIEMWIPIKERTIYQLADIAQTSPSYVHHVKPTRNAFEVFEGEESLGSKLRKAGATHLTLAGLYANSCVLDTMEGAFNLSQPFVNPSTARDLLSEMTCLSESTLEQMKKEYRTTVFPTHKDLTSAFDAHLFKQ